MNAEFQQERYRITMLRELLQMSQTEFARKISISQGALSQIESGRSRLSMETLKNLSSVFNVNCNWLVNGKGDIFYSSSKSKNSRTSHDFIPLINKKARAGYFKGYMNLEYIKTLDVYKIPGFENSNYRLFEVQGDSMIPTFFTDEIIITKKTDDYRGVEDNTLVVCLLPKELVVKRIEKIANNEAYFLAKCDNPDYEDIRVKYEDINEMWIIEGKVTRKLLNENGLDHPRIINIEKKVKELHEKMIKLLPKK